MQIPFLSLCSTSFFSSCFPLRAEGRVTVLPGVSTERQKINRGKVSIERFPSMVIWSCGLGASGRVEKSVDSGAKMPTTWRPGATREERLECKHSRLLHVQPQAGGEDYCLRSKLEFGDTRHAMAHRSGLPMPFRGSGPSCALSFLRS